MQANEGKLRERVQEIGVRRSERADWHSEAAHREVAIMGMPDLIVMATVPHFTDGAQILPDTAVCFFLIRDRVREPPEGMTGATSDDLKLLPAWQCTRSNLPELIQRL